MDKKSDSRATNSYFAAANGYTGFRSLFGEIFDSEKFDRLFVIKGGPGTGKSSILRRLIALASERGYESDAIYCSSDVNSLDGVILRNGRRSIAALDGTAPHEVDARYPGAKDEIVNLGDGFDIARLGEKCDKIIELTKSKKAAYEAAYSYLSLAGKIDSVTKGVLTKYTNYNEAERIAEELADRVQRIENNPIKRVYMSAFGRDGYVRISEAATDNTRCYTIYGSRHAVCVQMSAIYRALSLKGAVKVIALSPFDDGVIEAIETDECVYRISSENGNLCSDSLISHYTAATKALEAMYNDTLALAREAFSEASRAHFELEAIYSQSVDFSNNERILSGIIGRITEILEN